MRFVRVFAALVVLAILAAGFGGLVPVIPAADPPQNEQADDADQLYQLQKMFINALDQIERNYVTEVDRRRLIEAAIRGMLRELDPYSEYIDRDHLALFRSTVEAQFGGIGIEIGRRNGRLTVISPLLDTPAHKAGIIAGDVILAIDGKSTEHMSLDEASELLRGKPGTKVKLTIRHPTAAEPVQVEIVRDVIHVPTVVGYERKSDGTWDYFVDPLRRIAYVRLTAFSRTTADELRKVLQTLSLQGMRALVLDLRFNPGGLLGTAIAVCDLFVDEGVIVSARGRNIPERVWHAHKEGTFASFPMVVLVNRYSASGSEIVAACLQDHKRAVIVGERTWGKGSVQNLIPLEQGASALKLTTASYYRPSGKNIHRFPGATPADEWGVIPDEGFQLTLGPAEMVALLEDQRRREMVPPPDGKAEPTTAPEDVAGADHDGKKKEVPSDQQDDRQKQSANDSAESTDTASGQHTSAEQLWQRRKEIITFVDPQLRLALEYLWDQLEKPPQDQGNKQQEGSKASPKKAESATAEAAG